MGHKPDPPRYNRNLMKIAVLGLGFMGSTHLKALKNIPRATLAAIMSGDEKKLSGDLTGIQGNLGGPGESMDFSSVAKYRGVEEVLRDPNVEAVDICLPTDLHAPVAIEALRAGKHVSVSGDPRGRTDSPTKYLRPTLRVAHVCVLAS